MDEFYIFGIITFIFSICAFRNLLREWCIICLLPGPPFCIIRPKYFTSPLCMVMPLYSRVYNYIVPDVHLPFWHLFKSMWLIYLINSISSSPHLVNIVWSLLALV